MEKNSILTLILFIAGCEQSPVGEMKFSEGACTACGACRSYSIEAMSTKLAIGL